MSEPVGLGQVGLTVLRHWVLVTLGVIIGAGGAFGITLVVPETYTATSVQLIKGVPGTGVAANYEAAQYAVNRSKSYPAFIGSLQVLEGVRDDLGDSETVDELRLELSATNPTDTPLIRITATGRTAADAQAKANSAARHLSRFITQIEMVSGRSPVLVETAVQAGLPQDPSSPQVKLFIAVGAVLGLAITIAIALIRDHMPKAAPRSRRRRRTAQPIETAADETPPTETATVETSPEREHHGAGGLMPQDGGDSPLASPVDVPGGVLNTSPDPDTNLDANADTASSSDDDRTTDAVQPDLPLDAEPAAVSVTNSESPSDAVEVTHDETVKPWQWLAGDELDDLARARPSSADGVDGPDGHLDAADDTDRDLADRAPDDDAEDADDALPRRQRSSSASSSRRR